MIDVHLAIHGWLHVCKTSYATWQFFDAVQTICNTQMHFTRLHVKHFKQLRMKLQNEKLS